MRARAVLPALFLLPSLSAAQMWPADVEEALMFAGPNRIEIERALNHFAYDDDEQKLEALCFLVANMPGHGSIRYTLRDAAGSAVAFDALDHGSYRDALAAMEALEAEHGELTFEKDALVEDLHVLTGDDLIDNVERAFHAWRTNPWAADMTFETFRDHVLPHRGSNEPFEDWRGPLMERVAALAAELDGDGPPDAAKIAGVANRIATGAVGFNELYYLHPTDQAFSEMNAAGRGRCEDITNMTTYAMRAACVASAADYTPWWGHRDNNHAWPVVLDGAGRGRSGDGNRAAKVYRKTYAKQPGNLCFQLEPGEEAPPWLDRAHYADVTDQYFETHDVRVELAEEPAHRFAYLCVFNGGEWRPIHWARVADGAAVFDKMNSGLLYLPAFYHGGAIQPAGAPFHLSADGARRELYEGSPTTDLVTLPTQPGERYELFAWNRGWERLGAVEGGDGGTEHKAPLGALLWMPKVGGRRLERPFEPGERGLRTY